MLDELRAPPPSCRVSSTLRQQLSWTRDSCCCWASPPIGSRTRHDTLRRRNDLLRTAPPRMLLLSEVTTGNSLEPRRHDGRSDSNSSDIGDSVWKPSWDNVLFNSARRSETHDILTSADGYDVNEIERFFDERPERVWIRCMQVCPQRSSICIFGHVHNLSVCSRERR